MALEFDLNGVDGEQVGRLMEVLAQSDVEECEIEQGERRLRIKRTIPQSLPQARPKAKPAPSPSGPEPGLVCASTVGVFRRSERRSSSPKVEVGARVKAGDALGFVEVMNIPHSVLSPCEGIVESFLVEDGQPVEYGQPIVAIKV